MSRPALHVIGSSPAWSNPGEACSSYLVEAGGARILLDCGSGALGRLRATDPEPLQAVVLSHLHFDHIADLVPFAYALQLSELRAWEPPRLHAPPGGRERLRALCEAGGGAADLIERRFQVAEYDPQAALVIAGATLRFSPTRHPGGCYAVRVEAEGGALCYSGDTGPLDTLAPFAAGVGVLLCEATEGSAAANGVEHWHLTAAEAAGIAREAGAGALVLTHLPAADREAALAGARERFPGRVEAATPGLRIAG